jgi:hypothetical protein
VPTPAGYDLHGVTATSRSDAWAVGGPSLFPHAVLGAGHRPLALHWNGVAWRSVATPSVGGRFLAVAASSPTDVWAVGETGSATEWKIGSGGAGLATHWNGRRWQRVPVTAPRLTGIAAPARGDAWAVGGNAIYRWNGLRWSRARSVAHRTIRTVTAISPNDVWFVGDGPGSTYFELNWNGRRWQSYAQRADDTIPMLEAVVAGRADDVWAAGGVSPDLRNGVVRRFDGRRWLTIHAPSMNGDVAALAHANGRLWAASWDSKWWEGGGGFGATVFSLAGQTWQPTKVPPLDLVDALADDHVGGVWAAGLAGVGTDEQGQFPRTTRPAILHGACR